MNRMGVARVGLGLVALILASGCAPVFGRASGPVRHGAITSASGMEYRYGGNTELIQVRPGAIRDPNVREVFWYSGKDWYADQQSCLTWHTTAGSKPGGLLQPGVAVRVTTSGSDNTGVKAITVTENIWAYGIWIFNVHLMDSSNRANPHIQIDSFDASHIVGSVRVVDGKMISTMVPPPWHVCLRTVGRSLRFKIWTNATAEPAWGDPDHVFTTTLPADWTHHGYGGGYIGHLHPGQDAAFSHQRTQRLCGSPNGTVDVC